MRNHFPLKLLSSLLFSGLLSIAGHADASNLTIDNFNQLQNVTDRGNGRPGEVYVPGATSNSIAEISGSDLAHVSRTFSATATEGRYANKEEIQSGAGALKISNSAGSAGAASILWTFDPTNFTLYGSAILLEVLTIDLDVNIEMVVNDIAVAGSKTVSQTEDFWFDFNQFSNPSVFSNVSSLRLNFTGPQAWDGQFRLLTAGTPTQPDIIGSVPLPPSFVMMGTVLFGFLGAGRLRKATASSI
ncbi:hypothetical protein [Methylomonas sp. UP202]|uniref:hypothetical protein n=1 Tax=Methylomonas sp. UP202 TaxID=3040943 RepID=UPI00247AD988|nr:hypothetical protein [Methylomonas sp. UP202]WGS87865.1 hypothetical protein QC632_08905 [Methylomonas sp. UP202]